jgi:hypothetical protein
MNKALFLLLVLVFTGACKRQNQNQTKDENQIDSLRLSELLSIARSNIGDAVKQNIVQSRVFEGFDFLTFQPEDHVSSLSNNQILVGYNDKNQIVRLRKTFSGNDFEFTIFRNEQWGFSIFSIKPIFHEGSNSRESAMMRGFIMNYQNQFYFLSFDKDPFCVMQLDTHLQTVATLRFCSDNLIYRTKLTYHNSNVFSEIMYAPVERMIITNKTLYSDIVKLFKPDAGFKYEREMKIGWYEEWGDLPLWSDGGHHAFETQLSPSYKDLPRPELLYNCLRKPLRK